MHLQLFIFIEIRAINVTTAILGVQVKDLLQPFAGASTVLFDDRNSMIKCLSLLHMYIRSLLVLAISFLSIVSVAQSKVATIKVQASIYCDHCKRCESCGGRLEKAVFTERGIKRVDLDEESKSLTIIYNPQKTSPEKIRTAISKVGFDADDIKADPEAYEKLDECCKKQ